MCFGYSGNELHIFEKALNWKNYYGSMLKSFLRGDVLEVGAGIGGTTKILCDGSQRRWVCLEPDRNLSILIEKKMESGLLPACCSVQTGTIESLAENSLFGTILYIDVIEHIENDVEELYRATQHLAENGKLIVLAPAHQWLYSPFDKAIGHYRRYSMSMLRSIVPGNLIVRRMDYLDCTGLCVSLMNKVLLRQSQPSRFQIEYWDRYLIPISRFFDPILGHNIGKTILGIWEK